jgi:hypothetical protein
LWSSGWETAYPGSFIISHDRFEAYVPVGPAINPTEWASAGYQLARSVVIVVCRSRHQSHGVGERWVPAGVIVVIVVIVASVEQLQLA